MKKQKILSLLLAASLISTNIVIPKPVLADEISPEQTQVSENSTITNNETEEENTFEDIQKEEEFLYTHMPTISNTDIFSYDWKNATDEELSQVLAAQNPEDIRIWLKTLTEEEKDELLSRNTFLTQPYSVVNANGTVEDFDTFLDYLNSMPQRLNASIINYNVEYLIRVHFPNQTRTILCRQMSSNISPAAASFATPNKISDVHGTRWQTSLGVGSILYSVSSTNDYPGSSQGNHCPSTVYVNNEHRAAFPFIFQIEKPANCFINPTYCNVNTTIYNTIYNTDYPNFTVNGESAPKSFTSLDQREFDIEATGGAYGIKVNKLCLDTDASFSQFQNGQTIQFMILPTFMESGFLDTLPTNKYATYDLYFNQPIVRVQTDATISFKDLNNKTVNNFTQFWGEKLTLRGLSIAEKTGYQLKDWYILNTDQYTKQTKKYYIDNYLTPTITNTNIERGVTSPGDVTNYIDVTAHAEWTPITYSVRYNANGGSGAMSTSTHTYDQDQALNANSFSKTGYTFAGWATSQNGNVVYSDKAIVKNLASTNSATFDLYAKWNPITYKITYQANGGNGTMSASTHTYDTSKTLSKNTFTRTGYTFTGWATSAGGSTVYTDQQSVSNLSTQQNAQINLYATWKPNTYTITLNPDKGTVSPTSVTATYDSPWPSLPTPAKTGYTFKNWQGAGSGNYTIPENITLTAVWQPNTYTITLNPDKGTVSPTSVTATYDSPWPSLPTPTRSGYTFKNWQGVGSGNYTITGNTTLTATWQPNTYIITYDPAGGRFTGDETVSVTYDANIPTPPTAMKKGYTFKGWDDIDPQKPYTIAGDTKATAKWQANQYTVSFDLDGGNGTMKDIQAEYDQEFSIPSETPQKTGYEFVKWTDGKTNYVPSQTCNNLSDKDGDRITLKAVWKAITYSITLNGNGGTIGNQEQIQINHIYGQDKNLLNIVMPLKKSKQISQNGKTGQMYYLFSGWEGSDGNLYHSLENIAQSMTLTAKYEERFVPDTEKVTINPADGISDQEIEQAGLDIPDIYDIPQPKANGLLDMIKKSSLPEQDKADIIAKMVSQILTSTQQESVKDMIEKSDFSAEDKSLLIKALEKSGKNTNSVNTNSNTDPGNTKTNEPSANEPSDYFKKLVSQSQQETKQTDEPGLQTSDTVSLGKVTVTAKSKKKGKVVITLKKASNAKKYEIQISTKKNFKKIFKKKTTSKLSYTFKLGSKKTYYVRVRAINGKTKGNWSKPKKVKVK